MTTCPDCNRLIDPDEEGRCIARGTRTCSLIRDAFRRGMREGVEIAKERAEIERHTFRIVPTILWTDVDAELERRLSHG